MKPIEFVVLAAFALFWFIFFLLLCYYASKNRASESGRRDHWHGSYEPQQKSTHSQYVGAIGWFQNYRTRQNESKHELDLL